MGIVDIVFFIVLNLNFGFFFGWGGGRGSIVYIVFNKGVVFYYNVLLYNDLFLILDVVGFVVWLMFIK